eukprot:gene57751-biopygen17286
MVTSPCVLVYVLGWRWDVEETAQSAVPVCPRYARSRPPAEPAGRTCAFRWPYAIVRRVLDVRVRSHHSPPVLAPCYVVTRSTQRRVQRIIPAARVCDWTYIGVVGAAQPRDPLRLGELAAGGGQAPPSPTIPPCTVGADGASPSPPPRAPPRERPPGINI